MDKKIKNILIIILIIIFVFILFQIIKKIFMTSGKPQKINFVVSTQKLFLKEITEIIKIEGIAEGDPQIKVYPPVSGKFEKNLINEGDYVKKDAPILYINRDIIGFEYNLAPAKSPIEGIVIKLFFTDKGDAVMVQMPVAEIANPDKVKVVLSTGESDLIKIKKGQKAEIYSVHNKNIFLNGEVFSVTPFVNRDTLSGTVIVKAENKERKIKPGQSVEVKIETGKRETFLIPEDAILTGEDGTFIFINENNKAKKINIKTGYQEGEYIEIIGELNEGMEVITDGSFKLYENAELNIINKR